MKKGLFRMARRAPIVGAIIKEKVDKTKADMANDGPWVLPEGLCMKNRKCSCFRVENVFYHAICVSKFFSSNNITLNSTVNNLTNHVKS